MVAGLLIDDEENVISRRLKKCVESRGQERFENLCDAV